MITIEPYLLFNGDCAEAFAFYKEAFGAGNMIVMKYRDLPKNPDMPPGDEDRIAHVILHVGDTAIMGSDAPHSHPVHTGNNYSVCIAPDTLERAKTVSENLSAGGVPTMPAGETFWAEYYAGFTDKFGINWMINYLGKKKRQS